MSTSPHRLLLASAGTGKTYQLSGHFLRLLFEGVPPDRILATTFTRKAAGEILDRVLARLLDATRDPKRLADLGEVVGRPLDRGDCVALLAQVSRRLDRFRVRTLDSFFVHVGKLFALDLGLPPDWALVDELSDAELRAEALGRVLADCAPDERVELLRGLQREAASRSVHEAMLKVVKEARSAYLESTPDAWASAATPDGLADAELAALAECLAAIEPPRTKAGTPAKRWADNLSKAAASLEAGDWAGLIDGSLMEKVLGCLPSFDRRPIPDAVREVFRALGAHAAAQLVSLVAGETATARRFLERFDAAYRLLKRERGEYRFEDLPLALTQRGPLDDEARAALWFRLDGRIDHLLLDEFQDTAPMQWRSLAPLFDEVLADGLGERSFFCVGDVKQSIYGWRAAEPRLLAGLPSRYPVLQPEDLTRSYRSSQVVLDAVNAVFGALDHAAVLDDEERPSWRAAAADWGSRFAVHEAAHELPGAAVLRQARYADGEERPVEAALRTAIERAAALAQEAPHATIGVLVRTKKPIPRILHELRERGVRASGEGGNPLTDAESVQVFLSALHLADHPGDTAAAFHAASSPLAAALGVECEESAPVAARALRARLVREGYGPVAAGLLQEVEAAPEFAAWDRGRFRQLVDIAHAHDASAGLRPAEFCTLVRETAVEDPTASRVRVMTIHASKGLEFDAVVLPQLDQALVSRRAAFVHVRPDPFGPIERVSARPKKALLPFSNELRELWEQADARELEESLCVLYVAMTRAARLLEMVVPPPLRSGEASRSRDFARLLIETLGASGELDREDGVIWLHPDSRDDWHLGCGDGEELPEEGASECSSLRLAPTTRARALPQRTPSATEGGLPTAVDLLRPILASAAARGTLVHRWLEELEWIDDFNRSDAELLARAADIEPDEGARRDALAFLRGALERSELRELLARPHDAEAHEVLREHSFAQVISGEGGREELWSGEIDRLVLRHEGERIVAAEVIDYKTDAVDEDALDARVAHYRPQLEAYRDVAATSFGLDPGCVRARIAFLDSGRVVEV